MAQMADALRLFCRRVAAGFQHSLLPAAAFLVPANPIYSGDGVTIATPATLYWASGVFEDAFWSAIAQAAAALDWGGAWEYDIDNDPSFPQTKLAEIASQETFSLA